MLDYNSLKSVFEDSYHQYEEPRQIVLYTGWMGMITFDYYMMGLSIHCLTKFIYTKDKRSKQFNFIVKHGMYKARVNYKTIKLDVYYATKYLFSCTDLIDVDTYIKKHGEKNEK